MSTSTAPELKHVSAAWAKSYLSNLLWRLKHGRAPGFHGDEEETIQCRWTRVQRQRIPRKGDLSRDQVTLLQNLPFWSCSAQDVDWNHTCDRYLNFLFRRCRLPSRKSEDEEERELHFWFFNNTRFYRSGLMPEHRRERFADVARRSTVLGSRLDIDAITPAQAERSGQEPRPSWEESLSQLLAFLEASKRPPRQNSPSAVERRLSCWMMNNRRFCAIGKLDRERREPFRRAMRIVDKLRSATARSKKRRRTPR